jgi:molybdate transport system substrate-binding protein
LVTDAPEVYQSIRHLVLQNGYLAKQADSACLRYILYYITFLLPPRSVLPLFSLPLRCCLLAVTLLSWAVPGRAADLLVSAASSLTNALTDVARAYEAANPGSKVALNFGASGALLQQLVRGAPADILAAADAETMDRAAVQGLIDHASRRDFAANALVVVVPLESRTRLTRMADLGSPAITRIAIGNAAVVPVGRYSRRAIDNAGLWPVVASRAITTQNVRQSLDYVARGEVDAGFVYASDALQFRDKVRLAFTVPLDTPIRYPVAATRAGMHGDEARRFIAYLVSPAAQAILARHGFSKP